MGCNKVLKAWGSGDEKVVAKNFELLFNAVRSEEQAKDPGLPRRWQSKSIDKVEGRLGGANPVGGGVSVAHHPKRGVGKGFGAEGEFT